MTRLRHPRLLTPGLLVALALIAAELLSRSLTLEKVRAACEEGARLEAKGLFTEAAESFALCRDRDPAQASAWLAWAEALLRARGRPVYAEIRASLLQFVASAREDPETDPVELQAIEELIQDLEELLAAESPAERSGPWTVDEIVEILLRENIRGNSRYEGPRVPLRLDFRPGDATLGQVAKEQLREVGKALRDGVLAGIPIEIEGHTDSIEAGTESGRRALARKRAEAARTFLVHECGIPATQLQAVSLADTYPLKPNSTDEGRTANRRVELVNMESKKQLLKDVRSPD